MREVTRRGLALSAALAMIAGYVDALGFIGTGGLFVSFMSGNSTRGGVDLLSGNLPMAVLALGLVVAFVFGATAGAAVGQISRHRLVVLWSSAILLAAVAIWDVLAPGQPWKFLLLAVSMGALNTLFVSDGRARVAVTYATGTLVSVGIGLAEMLTGGNRALWQRPLILWAALTAGAVFGALAHVLISAWAFWAAVAAIAAVAIIAASRRFVWEV